jgi:hypothetical protein
MGRSKLEPRFCKIKDCNRKVEARGLCCAHYKRLLLHGDVKAAQPVRSWALGALAGFLLLAAIQIASAAPFLVCDPYAVQAETGLNVVSFIVTGLSANPLTVQATINTDGSQYLHYDLGSLPKQQYTVTASAVNGYGGVSSPTAPFVFTLGVPITPSNLRLSSG